MNKKQILYPFTAIVGQDDMKTALILNVVNPLLGGVLIRGEKGTAKSTAVRALADLLPLRREVQGCPFHCDPDRPEELCPECRTLARSGPLPAEERPMGVVNLPVSATEDRVVGTLDIEHALRHGEKKFEPGILAWANRSILYVDEVNLLDDHVVDVLLDAAAMGVNTVEREGVSYTHPSRFVLVGTMNPEEGDLRPQLLDRFGLVVDVAGEQNPADRVQVIRRRMAFEDDPESFTAQYADSRRRLSGEISAAKARLSSTVCPDELIYRTAEIAVRLQVDGHRADITMIKAAITHAAYHSRSTVTRTDLAAAARLTLPHRMRRRPFEEGVVDLSAVYALIEDEEMANYG